MTDEIKEILDELKDSVNYPIIDVPTMDGTDSEPMENTVLLEPNESKIILDCITNLQEENERLSRTITDYDELLMQKNNVIDKAIEYCNLYTRLSAKDLLNILEGDKDE